MKKAICIVSILILLSSLVACGLRVDAAGEKTDKIIFLTDKSEAEDDAMISSVWKGLCTYGEETNCTYLRVSATEPTKEARLCALKNNMGSEVKVVVCLGSAYESMVFEAQKAYPDVMFLLLDGEPHEENTAVYETTANTHCVLYQEIQAGFLAGYAAVMEGNTNLGFCGDRADPAVTRYGYGFIQGADKAATNLGMKKGAIQIRYWYAGMGQTAQRIQNKMTEWYASGTQIVFASGNGNPKLTQNVIFAAVSSGGKVFGADANWGAESKSVICSVLKEYGNSIQQELSLLKENNWRWNADQAGRTTVLGIKEDAVKLSDDSAFWRMNTFTMAQYQEVLGQMKADAITIEQNSSRKLFPAVSICSIIDQGEG